MALARPKRTKTKADVESLRTRERSRLRALVARGVIGTCWIGISSFPLKVIVSPFANAAGQTTSISLNVGVSCAVTASSCLIYHLFQKRRSKQRVDQLIALRSQCD